MVDKQSIDTTFKRIEKSLDLRFQKKGTLYITKEDLEIAKKSLYKNEFQNFIALGTKVGMPVLIQVLLKNPWLINTQALKDKELRRLLTDELGGSFAKQYMQHMRHIVEDEIFSTVAFKEFVEKRYYKLLNVEDCQTIYQDIKYKPEIRALCFLKEMEVSDEKGSYIIRQVNDMFQSDFELYKSIKDSDSLNRVMQNISEKDDVAEWIMENKTDEKMDSVWAKAFMTLEQPAFSAAMEYITSSDMEYNDTTKWLIKKVIPQLFSYAKNDDDLVDSYIEEIISIYRHRDAYHIRPLFIYMLKPSKFKNKDLAMKLLSRFEQIGIKDSLDDMVLDIKSWEDKKDGYISLEDAYRNLTINQDFSRKGTLEFAVSQFKKADNKIIEQLYNNYGNELDIRKPIAYFLTRELDNNSMNIFNILAPLSNEYIGQMTEYIDEYTFDSNMIKSFLFENNKHQVLAKINRR